jgi:hypothetical protein
MKTKIIMSVICALLISCNGQKKEAIKPINNTIVMKKIDTNYLNKIKEIGKKNQKIQLVENDSVVELVDEGDIYFESRRKNNEFIYNFFSYDKKNHLIFASGTIFHNIPIGIFRRYNEKGELIEEINRDKNYPFSVYDLIEKIKVTHKIDLNNASGQSYVSREFDKVRNIYIYMIAYENDKNKVLQNGQSKYISVNGQTGEIVSEGIAKINLK